MAFRTKIYFFPVKLLSQPAIWDRAPLRGSCTLWPECNRGLASVPYPWCQNKGLLESWALNHSHSLSFCVRHSRPSAGSNNCTVLENTSFTKHRCYPWQCFCVTESFGDLSRNTDIHVPMLVVWFWLIEIQTLRYLKIPLDDCNVQPELKLIICRVSCSSPESLHGHCKIRKSIPI